MSSPLRTELDRRVDQAQLEVMRINRELQAAIRRRDELMAESWKQAREAYEQSLKEPA